MEKLGRIYSPRRAISSSAGAAGDFVLAAWADIDSSVFGHASAVKWDEARRSGSVMELA